MRNDKFVELVKSTLLTKQEHESMNKLSDKNPEIRKLIAIHDALYDKALKDPIAAKAAHIEYMKDAIQKAIDFISEDCQDDAVDSEQDDLPGGAPRMISIFASKTNGLPERIRDLDKALGEASEDLLGMISAHRALLQGNSTTEEDLTGLSFSDIQALKKRGKKI